MREKVNKKLAILISVLVLSIVGVILAVGLGKGWLEDKFNLKLNGVSGETSDDGINSGEESFAVSGEDGIIYKNYNLIKQVENVKLTNIKVGKVNNSKCLFEAEVENISEKFWNGQVVNISTIDESGEVKEIFNGFLDDLAGLEKGKFKTQVLSDITYAKDFEIEVVNE